MEIVYALNLKKIKLKKLIDTYCNRNGYSSSSVRFLYEGESIKESDTPEIKM